MKKLIAALSGLALTVSPLASSVAFTPAAPHARAGYQYTPAANYDFAWAMVANGREISDTNGLVATNGWGYAFAADQYADPAAPGVNSTLIWSPQYNDYESAVTYVPGDGVTQIVSSNFNTLYMVGASGALYYCDWITNNDTYVYRAAARATINWRGEPGRVLAVSVTSGNIGTTDTAVAYVLTTTGVYTNYRQASKGTFIAVEGANIIPNGQVTSFVYAGKDYAGRDCFYFSTNNFSAGATNGFRVAFSGAYGNIDGYPTFPTGIGDGHWNGFGADGDNNVWGAYTDAGNNSLWVGHMRSDSLDSTLIPSANPIFDNMDNKNVAISVAAQNATTAYFLYDNFLYNQNGNTKLAYFAGKAATNLVLSQDQNGSYELFTGINVNASVAAYQFPYFFSTWLV